MMSTSKPKRGSACLGSPPRLRLMERGFTYEEATIVSEALEEAKKRGSSYEEGMAAARKLIQNAAKQ